MEDESFTLEVNDYQFIVDVYKDSDREIEIYVGYANKPCIFIIIDEDSDIGIVLEILEYNDETQIMIKSALQWLFDTYANLKSISFMDKSKSKEDNVYLAEKMVLTEGKTWYQKYVQAEPDGKLTEILHKIYYSVFEKHRDDLRKLPIDVWKPDMIKETLSKYHILEYKQITGTSWIIHRKTIMNYNMKYKLNQTLPCKTRPAINIDFLSYDIWRYT